MFALPLYNAFNMQSKSGNHINESPKKLNHYNRFERLRFGDFDQQRMWSAEMSCESRGSLLPQRHHQPQPPNHHLLCGQVSTGKQARAALPHISQGVIQVPSNCKSERMERGEHPAPLCYSIILLNGFTTVNEGSFASLERQVNHLQNHSKHLIII